MIRMMAKSIYVKKSKSMKRREEEEWQILTGFVAFIRICQQWSINQDLPITTVEQITLKER